MEKKVSASRKRRKGWQKDTCIIKRKAHVDFLRQHLNGTRETITLTGKDIEQSKKETLQLIEGNWFSSSEREHAATMQMLTAWP